MLGHSTQDLRLGGASRGSISSNSNNKIIASRIPAARPEGSLFAVPGFLSLCVRKLHYPAEEEDDECSAFSQSVGRSVSAFGMTW